MRDDAQDGEGEATPTEGEARDEEGPGRRGTRTWRWAIWAEPADACILLQDRWYHGRPTLALALLLRPART